MKKRMIQIIAFFVTIVLSINSMVSAFASVSEESTNDVYIYYNKGGIVVDGYTDSEGNEIFRQYENGRLVQRNTIPVNQREVIKVEYFGINKSTRNLQSQNIIKISDFGSVVVETLPEISTFASPNATHHYAGQINYKALLNNGVKKYSLKCNYATNPTIQSTYTIRNYVGPLVTLVSLVVGALNLPQIVASKFITNLIYGVGTVFISGEVEYAFSAKVASKDTKYEWTLTEVGNTNHKKIVEGHRYYVNDQGSSHYSEIHYTGYVPKDWKTTALGLNFHYEMFPYSSFQILGWTK